MKIRQGGFPFTRTFNALEMDGGKNVSYELMKKVRAQYPTLDHWSQPFDTSPENYNASFAAAQNFVEAGVDLVPVVFTTNDVNPVTKRDAFVEFLKSQVRFAVQTNAASIMILPEAWRYNTLLAPLTGDDLLRFMQSTAQSIADGLSEAPGGFFATLEMLSPHELRHFNNMAIIRSLLFLVREKLEAQGLDINLFLTMDMAHIFYPTFVDRPGMIAFKGEAQSHSVLLADFGNLVSQGLVFQLHDSVPFSRCHPLCPSRDGQYAPREDFLMQAKQCGFEGLLTTEVMNPLDPVIIGSGLEGMTKAPTWDPATPEEPIITALNEQKRILGL